MSKLIANYIAMWKKMFDFKTRSRREEYWLACLGNSIVSIVICMTLFAGIPIIFSLIGMKAELGLILAYIIYFIYGIPASIASMALCVRRLHDTGLSGWMYLIALTGIGSIVLLIFFCMDSQPGVNKYGANPKGV